VFLTQDPSLANFEPQALLQPKRQTAWLVLATHAVVSGGQ
jgi:hypothetical protein